jgi:hypothetical protein
MHICTYAHIKYTTHTYTQAANAVDAVAEVAQHFFPPRPDLKAQPAQKVDTASSTAFQRPSVADYAAAYRSGICTSFVPPP